MTKEQIIEALKCCAMANSEVCKRCPVDMAIKDDGRCCSYLAKNALSLINEITAKLDDAQLRKADKQKYMRDYFRERRKRLKADGKCPVCGQELAEEETYILCDFCRKKQKEHDRLFREKRRAEKDV